MPSTLCPDAELLSRGVMAQRVLWPRGVTSRCYFAFSWENSEQG